MIQVIGQRELLAFEKTKPGDLVTFAYDGEKAIGIIFEFNEDREPLIGAISSSFGLPRLLRQDARDRCVTCGADWAIEPEEATSTAPGPANVGRRAGLLALTSQGWLMNFASTTVNPSGEFGWEWRSLATLGAVEGNISRAAIYDTWKIWAPVAERGRAGAAPVLEYRAIAIGMS